MSGAALKTTLIVIALLGVLVMGLKFLMLAPMRVEHQMGDELRRQQIREFEALDQAYIESNLVTREVVLEVGDAGYREPARSALGGFDVEERLADATERLSTLVLTDWNEIWRWSRPEHSTVLVKAKVPNDRKDVELAKRVARILRRRGIPASASAPHMVTSSAEFTVSHHQLAGHGEVVQAEVEEETYDLAVVIDPDMKRPQTVGIPTERLLRLGFKTELQTSMDYARADAHEGLDRRVRARVWELAMTRLGISPEKEIEFKTELDQRFGAGVLASLGTKESSIVTTRLVTESGEDVYYQGEVSWAGDRARLTAVARTVERVLEIREREPWVRGGLSLGVLVLAILGWLKVDWWLKGRHSFLSKVAFVIVAIVGIGLSLNVPFHV